PRVAELARSRPPLDRASHDGLVLVGRRDLRSNNSWMHNLDVLVKGKPRCTLHIQPDDAPPRELANGDPARVVSATGTVVVHVEVTDAVMCGVVSLPHGWGHDVEGVDLAVAAAHAGVNSNVLSSRDALDPLSGNAVLNGIPVEVH